ncbi:ATP-dependent Clp protease proteolytic subunit [[Erwinia] mediterraneensis]|uniref:ATP-dependent Clp protease proteolytic subunit n=1 Tax=[Erwinia] mediterraneensis TaxID=2161819 RepID=UPI00102FB2CE|nr:ATP-dependent Clp protease proteolytic subunit [[Erwinia] mediterraneensis]
MLKRNFFFLLLAVAPLSQASTSIIINKNQPNENVKSAKVVFTGEVTAQKITELMSAIDDINVSFAAVKEIQLYINSYGGEMEAGYMGGEAIKGSRIPIRTINAAMTGSAATLIYCAAKNRETFPGATFLLHPAATPNIQNNYLQKNQITLLNKEVDKANDIFREVYKHCLKNSDIDMEKVLFSEDNRTYIRYPEALKYGIASGVAKHIAPADVSYYITSPEEKN